MGGAQRKNSFWNTHKSITDYFKPIKEKEAMSGKYSRRDMLKIIALASAGGIAAGCSPAATPVPTAEPAATSVPNEEPTATNVPDEPTAPPPATDPTKITMVEMVWGVPQDKSILDRVGLYLSKRAQADGVNVEFSSILLDNRDQQYPVLYASGEKFTFAFDAPWLVMPSLIDQEYLLPLEDLLPEHAPNIVKTNGDTLNKANYIKGHLYGLVAWFYFGQTSGVILREDLRKKYNVPEIGDTYESLEPFLKAIKENEPDMIPFVVDPNGQIGFGQGDDNFNSFDAPWYSPANRLKGSVIPDLWKDAKYADLEDQETFKRYAELSYKWAQAGYIGYPSTAAGTTDLLNAGQVAAINENEPDFKYVQYQAGITTEGIELKGYDMSGQHSGRVKKNRRNKQWNFIVFNNQAPKEESIAGLQFFNWIYGDQSRVDAWLFGEDGVDHKFLPDMKYEVAGEATTRYRRNWFVGGVPGTMERIPVNTPQDAIDTLKFLSTPDNFLLNPIEGFDPDVKPVETLLASYDAIYPEARYPIVSGTVATEEALANWKAKLDSAGRQDLKAEFQKQLDAWIKANPA